MDVHQDVQALIEGKLRCIQQLTSLTRDLLSRGDLSVSPDTIAEFDDNRSRLFTTLELIDRRLASVSELPAELASRLAPAIRELLELDAHAAARIQAAGESLVREIRERAQIRGSLGKFKSQWMPDQGSELDVTL